MTAELRAREVVKSIEANTWFIWDDNINSPYPPKLKTGTDGELWPAWKETLMGHLVKQMHEHAEQTLKELLGEKERNNK